MIPVVEEPADIAEGSGLYEKCHFCKISTKYWHEESNTPVCLECASSHNVSELAK